MVDGNANPVWEARYSPFGEADPLINVVDLPFRFPGQYFDAETGMYYNYFRDYDPSIGRYAQSDPIGILGGVNTYGYADANPLARFDPFGLAPDWVGPAGTAATATGVAGLEAARRIPHPAAKGYVFLGSAALIAAGAGLTYWDWVTTPSEMAEDIKNSESFRQIEDSLREIEREIEVLNDIENCE